MNLARYHDPTTSPACWVWRSRHLQIAKGSPGQRLATNLNVRQLREIEGVNETKLQEVNHLPDMLDCSTVSGYPHVIQFLLLTSLVCGKYILIGRCQSIFLYVCIFAMYKYIYIHIFFDACLYSSGKKNWRLVESALCCKTCKTIHCE